MASDAMTMTGVAAALPRTAPLTAARRSEGAIISMRGIRKTYRSATGDVVEVLKGVDLDLTPGSFNVIRGESGSGKTSLLRILGMLDSQFEGDYRFGDDSVGEQPDWRLDELRSGNIGFIFQEGRLFDHLDVHENITLPVRLLGTLAERQALNRTIGAMAPSFFTGEELAKKILSNRPTQVSGGQKQRASIMRAVIKKHAVILADEPTASLDESRKLEILKKLRSLSAAGHTVIVVSHDKVFHGSGRQLELRHGTLRELAPEEPASEDPLSIQPTESGASLLYGWRPRAPWIILLRQAARETLLRPIFLFLIVVSLCVGVTQIGVFSSIILGAGAFIEDAMTKGSRLNRLEIKPRFADFQAENRFPATEEIRSWGNVQAIVPRRETVASLMNYRFGKAVQYTAMGLHSGDPEYGLLDFVAGGPFSGGHDGLEVIVTVALLPEVLESTAGLADGSRTYGDLIGQAVTIHVPKYAPNGKVFRVTQIKLKLVGIVLHAEGGRQLYLPNTTQLVFDSYKRDKAGQVQLPLTAGGDAWTSSADAARIADFPWEDRLQVYTTQIREIIPVFQQLSKLGYKPNSDIWDVKWVLDVQDLAWKIFIPMLVLIIVAVVLTVVSNILSSAKLRETEFALWRILGMRRGDLVVTQVLSTAMMVMAGAIAGLLIASLLVNGARRFLAGQHADSNFEMVFAPVGQFFGVILVAALVVGILSAIYPAWRTARVDPAKVLQS